LCFIFCGRLLNFLKWRPTYLLHYKCVSRFFSTNIDYKHNFRKWMWTRAGAELNWPPLWPASFSFVLINYYYFNKCTLPSEYRYRGRKKYVYVCWIPESVGTIDIEVGCVTIFEQAASWIIRGWGKCFSLTEKAWADKGIISKSPHC